MRSSFGDCSMLLMSGSAASFMIAIGPCCLMTWTDSSGQYGIHQTISSWKPLRSGFPNLQKKSKTVMGTANLVLGRGELSSSFKISLILQTPTELRGNGYSRLRVEFSPSTGLFLGRAEVPGTTLTLGFRGAVLQNRNGGFG